MKRSLRKAIAFALAVMMLLTGAPVSASAAETDKTTSSSVTTLADTVYDEAVTFSDSVAFLQNGHWSDDGQSNVTADTTIVFMDAQGKKTELKNNDGNGNQLFDAIYPMISDGYYQYDAIKVVKDGKMSYIRADADNPYYGTSLQWYDYAHPLNDQYLIIGDETGYIIDVAGNVVVPTTDEIWTRVVGNCVYVGAAGVAGVRILLSDGQVKHEQNKEFKDTLGNGYALLVDEDAFYLYDANGNLVETIKKDLLVGSSIYTLYTDTVESGYIVILHFTEEWDAIYQIWDMKTDTVVLCSYDYGFEFDGNVLIGHDVEGNQFIASVEGVTYISDLDAYVTEDLATDSYEELTYKFYYVNGSLLISLSDCADAVEAETYVLTKETAFADSSKKHIDGIVDCFSYDEEFVMTRDNDWYIDTMATTKGDTVKVYGDTNYGYTSALSKHYSDETRSFYDEIDGFSFRVSMRDAQTGYSLGHSYITEDGQIHEARSIETSGNFILDYSSSGEGVKVINADNKVVYNNGDVEYGNVKAFWYQDYFTVTLGGRVYLYDRDGNLILGNDKEYVAIGDDEIRGSYPATDYDYCGAYDYFNETLENGLCIVKVKSGDTYKYGAISFADVEVKNGLHKDEKTGKWYYYVEGNVDRTYYGVATNESGTWYVENGEVNFGVNGVVKCGTDWYCFKNGKVDQSKKGLCSVDGIWYLFENGKVQNVTTLANNSSGWWYVKNGKVDFTYDGVASNSSGTWYIENGKVDFTKNGLHSRGGNWYLFKNGSVNKITTLANNSSGWWYVKNGQIDFTYDGVASNSSGTWYIENGKVDFTKNGVLQRGDWYCFKNGKVDQSKKGLCSVDGIWYLFENGKVQNVTTLANNSSGWWYVKNGKVDFTYDGVASNSGGTWYIENGKVDFNKTGLYSRGSKWYLFKNGKVNKTTTLANNSGGWWYVKNGQVDFTYDGVASNSGGTWYIENGKVDFTKNGLYERGGSWYLFKNGSVNRITTIAQNSGGKWYVKNGQVDFSYTGIVKINGISYNIKNGKVIN